MNEEFILHRIKPYLNEYNTISEGDFNNLFSVLDLHHQYEVIRILIENNIDINYEENDYVNNNVTINKQTDLPYKRLDYLTNEQLCLLYQQGNCWALEALADRNKKLVMSRAYKYFKIFELHLDEDDLVEYGYFGLIKAAKRFDIQMGTKFVTYATWWIDQSIMRSICDYGYIIRIPVHLIDTTFKVLRIMKMNYEMSNDCIKKIMAERGIAPKKFDDIMFVINNILSVDSLNRYVGEDIDDSDTELIDFITDKVNPSLEEEVEQKLLKEVINDVLGTLKPREEKIIKMRYGLDGEDSMTLEQIGKKFNVTRERIRQIEEKALRRLRHSSWSKKLKDYMWR